MDFNFQTSLPDGYIGVPVLISGPESSDFRNYEYLVLDSFEEIYEIRYAIHSGSFREAILHREMLAVGHEEHFYLFDIYQKKNIYTLQLDGYFGHLYLDGNYFYVTDANGIYCIDKSGLHWSNNVLAIDGVIINAFTSEQILGEAEVDPPGGWKDFILDKNTGNFLS